MAHPNYRGENTTLVDPSRLLYLELCHWSQGGHDHSMTVPLAKIPEVRSDGVSQPVQPIPQHTGPQPKKEGCAWLSTLALSVHTTFAPSLSC